MPESKFWKAPFDWLFDKLPDTGHEMITQWFVVVMIILLISGCCVEVFVP